jgi:hypothetical protein
MLKMTAHRSAVVQAGVIAPGQAHDQPAQRPAGFVLYHPRAGARRPELDLKLVVNNAGLAADSLTQA